MNYTQDNQLLFLLIMIMLDLLEKFILILKKKMFMF